MLVVHKALQKLIGTNKIEVKTHNDVAGVYEEVFKCPDCSHKTLKFSNLQVEML